ncbi:MAG: HD-GYP domain-containing protein [Armatimonadota bacterium]|nr:HD-GYP domain-containing protein [Armatimonadota bacterium]MDR7450991.1 HD-GYP domain-containing protein [Armatimonadota bacterium]MDR7465988.1 HD-GYP domain-containing protein [Armatimonadota bacterium]MDR7494053.1 HD-GYP domain-containing protein [Armatimonadota bacterium]MDR7504080.1 HD-GYP domain-containing protein [Armatimonadota bacterium]
MTLLGRFTVTSAALAIILAVALGIFVSGQVGQAALREAAATTVQAADSLLTPYLVKGDFVHPLWPARMNDLTGLLQPHLLENGIREVRLWGRDGRIVYSNNPEHIAMETATAPQVWEALAGRPIAVLGTTRQFLHVFAPVRLVGESVPNGVYEVTLSAAPLLAHIQQARVRAWAYVLGGILLLYAVLVGLVYRASRTLVEQQASLQAAFEGTIQALAAAIDAKDAYTGGHSAEVSRHAEATARALRLPAGDVEAVRIAGYLHDLGKIGIPDQILRKAGPLDPLERERVSHHSVIGYRILRPIPVDDRIKLAVLHTHERWDGTGYPDGLTGNRIPIHARILMVADAYEAMTSSRPYRQAIAPTEAVAHLRREAGRQFDPDVVEAFIRALRIEGQAPIVPRAASGRLFRHPWRVPSKPS